MPSRSFIAALAVLALLATACEPQGQVGRRPTPQPPGSYPSSMAALGDSVTAGFGACLALISCNRNSWATGDGLRVDSHYRLIAEENRAIRGNAYNFAVPRARAADLRGQVEGAVRAQVEYVTVLIGANDACRGTAAEMTGAAAFRSGVDSALAALKKGLPKARVLVASVPDLYRLWEIGHTNTRAVRSWSYGVCPSLLAAPTSQVPADVSRREAVRERVAAYNRELAGACRAYGSRCRYDGGAVHKVAFTIEMLNPLDYFHPDADGQNTLASVTYPGRFTW